MEKFHIGTVLSVTAGFLLAPEPRMKNVYKILNYMTGDDLFTHQLPRALGEVRPEINKQLPWTTNAKCLEMCRNLEQRLEELKGDREKTTEIVDWFVADMGKRFGEYHELEAVPFSVEHRDPIEELASMVPREKIIVIE